MKFESERNGLVDRLLVSCRKTLPRLREFSKNEKVCGLVFYCASGCTSVGLSLLTRESLERRLMSAPKKLDSNYVQFNAFEWEYLNINYEAFREVDEFIEEAYEKFYDADLDDDEIGELFIDAFVRTINELKMSNAFSDSKVFETELLLGLQYNDPSPKGLEMTVQVSEKVNPKNLHEGIVINCEKLRSLK